MVARRLPPHPPPPPDLDHRDLPLVAWSAPLYRAYRSRSPTGDPYAPLHFSSTGTGRYDIPDGVCYAGMTMECAFIETAGREADDGSYTNLVDVAFLIARGRAELVPTAPLLLVDLAGPGLRRLGADGRLDTCDDYHLTQAWALAVWGHPQQPDGISYLARHDLTRGAVALFRRAAVKLQVRPLGSWFDDGFRSELGRILDHYGFGLIDSGSP